MTLLMDTRIDVIQMIGDYYYPKVYFHTYVNDYI